MVGISHSHYSGIWRSLSSYYRRKNYCLILMIIEIMVLGFFISTLGSSFVETWIDKKERKNKRLEGTTDESEAVNSSSHSSSSIKDGTISMVKNRIDKLESLKEDEFEMLLSLLKTIYYRRN